MNAKQRKFFKILTKKVNGSYLITGDAGTGKTYLAIKIIEHKLHQGKYVTVLCPTHQAKYQFSSKLENAQHSRLHLATVASFLKQFPVPDSVTGELVFQRGGFESVKEDIILVDETSMVSEYEMEQLLLASEAIPVIFLADYEQLLPVMKKQGDKHKTLKTFTLTEQQRNAGPILALCSQLRKELVYPTKSVVHPKGCITVHKTRDAMITAFLTELERIKRKYDVCYLAYRNVKVNEVRDMAHELLYGKKVFVKGMYLRLNGPSRAGENGSIVKVIKVEDKFEQRIAGDKYKVYVIKVRNLDTKLAVSIEALSNKSQSRLAARLKDLYDLSAKAFKRKKDVWEECQEYIKQIHKVTFYGSAFVMTCHKAQGRSIPSVYVDTEDISTGHSKKRLMYVGISRAINHVHTVKVKPKVKKREK